jgi:hypothetical protein
MSTAQKYGLRSMVQVGVLIGLVVRQGVITGTSGLSAQLYSVDPNFDKVL